MRLLLAEDEVELANALSAVLKHKNYSVDAVYNGIDAYNYAIAQDDDGIILDIMMPGMDGIQVLTKLREKGIGSPVLLLTAKSDIDDRITGLDSGADDYLTKPFSVDELLARLRVTVRRLSLMQTDMTQNKSVFENGDLKIDYAAGCAYLNGEELHLTPIEYKLLILLSRNVGRVLTYTYITKNIWGSSWENDLASLRVFMATLRKKIEKDVNSPQYIQTHIGIGYRMLRV